MKTGSGKIASHFLFIFISLMLVMMPVNESKASDANTGEKKRLAYLVSDFRIPFWNIMWRGMKNKANQLGYEIEVYSAENNTKKELLSLVQAFDTGISGLIVSPISSSSCATLLKLAKKRNVPVVISDIGTDSGEYVSYISSNNHEGAYQLGKILAKKMKTLGIDDGRIGIVAIPQKRINGQLRTAGFMQAMQEAGIKSAAIKQQSDFSHKETYQYTRQIIEGNDDIRAIFIQGSDRYQAALDAIADTGNKGKILLISFDAEPEFIDLISNGVLVGSAMQQPFMMGEKAVESLHQHLQGKQVKKKQELEILAISADNIKIKLSIINRNVLGKVQE
jgi:ribose transport system substrate-binding protein